MATHSPTGSKGPTAPSMIVEAIDQDLGPLGYVVIDREVDGRASGGVRFAPGITPAEISVLARTMTLKWAFVNIPMGGAKAGISLPPDATNGDRKRVMSAFGRSIGPLVRRQVYLPGIDLGTTLADLRILMEAAGQPLPETQIDGSLCTALTVFEALRQAARFRGYELNDLTVALEGFGKVAGEVARLVGQNGARLVAVSTIKGAIARPEGFDVPQLLTLRDTYGDSFVEHVEGARRLPVADLVTVEADVVIPGARPWVIHEDNVDQIGCRIVVPIANAPVTLSAEEKLTARGVLVVPDFVANCGGIYASELLSHGFSLADGEAIIRAAYGQIVAALMERAVQSGRSLGEEARALAWRRHVTLSQPNASRPSALARLLRNRSAQAVWRRAAWRWHRVQPNVDGGIRRAAAERLTELTLGETLRDLKSHPVVAASLIPSTSAP
jgi:glutamate dehydrogenase (NAD(P)+)